MDVEYLIGSVLRGVLNGRGRRKKVKDTLGYVLGNPRLVGAGAVLLGGLAYQWYESMTKGGATASTSPPPGSMPRPAAAPTPPGATVVPPPLPGIQGAAPAAPGPPPLPVPASSTPPAAPSLSGASSPTPDVASVPPEVLRVIRLSLSAARADGALTPAEQEAILTQARAAGAETLIAEDLRHPRPLTEILAGVEHPLQRQQLYAIAVAIVRADEDVTPQEREYLQGVAGLLGLDPVIAEQIERDAATGIQAAARA